nr:probable NEDD8-conjugating enzyme Ubc12-like [Malus domestica]
MEHPELANILPFVYGGQPAEDDNLRRGNAAQLSVIPPPEVVLERHSPPPQVVLMSLNMPEECKKISFPNGKVDLMDFEITITPYRGYYMGSGFVFTFKVPAVYHHEPPKVKCKTKIYHPNIDLEGNTCLNILREDWKPVLNINTVIYGLYHLFTEPNIDLEAGAVAEPKSNSSQQLLRCSDKSGEKLSR